MIKEFKEVIDDLIQGIETIKTTWENIRELNPDFEQVSEEEWRSKEALCWLHGGTKFQETVELEQWLYFYAKGSETADSLASKYHDEWGEYIREEGVYLDFKQSNLIATKEGESLLDYIQRCATLIEDNGWGGKKSKRAFKSFLAYLRKFNKEEEIAFIAHIFPEKIKAYLDFVSLQFSQVPDYAATTFIASIAGIIGRSIHLRMRPHDVWYETANCWCMLVGPPSAKKSPIMRRIFSLFKPLDKQASEEFVVANKSYRMRKKQAEDCKEDFQEPPPIRKRYVTDDVTTPKLRELMGGNTGRQHEYWIIHPKAFEH